MTTEELLQELQTRGAALGSFIDARKNAKEGYENALQLKSAKLDEYTAASSNATEKQTAFELADEAHDTAIEEFRTWLGTLQVAP